MTARTLMVSLHAISRWRERSPDCDGTDDEIRAKIGAALARSRIVRLRGCRERVGKALTHGSLATFHHFGEVVLVVTESDVVSVYSYERRRWEVLP